MTDPFENQPMVLRPVPGHDALKKVYTRPIVKPRKIHNNDPCFCGSGVKFKNCCKGSLLAEMERYRQ